MEGKEKESGREAMGSANGAMAANVMISKVIPTKLKRNLGDVLFKVML